jgi:O-acetyl-ADP-ribose deacetylase (regulator of RNase III)
VIIFCKGDLLDDDAEYRVNTVNCVGVMGKGIALQFKNANPRMFVDYNIRCKMNQYKPGSSYLVLGDDGRKILLSCTKDHWRNPSQMSWIDEIIQSLSRIETSVALPPIGCGNGGLDWPTVRGKMIDAWRALPGDFRVYGKKD